MLKGTISLMKITNNKRPVKPKSLWALHTLSDNHKTNKPKPYLLLSSFKAHRSNSK